MPTTCTGTSDPGVAQCLGDGGAHPAGAATVLDDDHEPVLAGGRDQLGGDRLAPSAGRRR